MEQQTRKSKQILLRRILATLLCGCTSPTSCKDDEESLALETVVSPLEIRVETTVDTVDAQRSQLPPSQSIAMLTTEISPPFIVDEACEPV